MTAADGRPNWVRYTASCVDIQSECEVTSWFGLVRVMRLYAGILVDQVRDISLGGGGGVCATRVQWRGPILGSMRSCGLSRAEMAEFVVVDYRIDSDGSGCCIAQHRGWGRGDVGEQIGIDCDAVSPSIALDAQGAGPLLYSDEHKITTWQAEAGVAVCGKQSTYDSSVSGTGPHGSRS